MQLEQVGPYLWRIPRDAGRGMRVPGLVVADERLLTSIRSDASLEQIANGATLPGIVRAALAMPDIHQGYGLPVGGVVATDAERGVISPGAIGFDINCGVRLLKTPLDAADIAARIEPLVDALYAAIPTGVGSRGALTLDARTLDEVMARGAAWAVERGYGVPGDLERIESGGRLDGADPGKVSDRARERGLRYDRREMCRNIRTLYNFEPAATEEEVRASALQYVRKISGFTNPSRANEPAFERAVDAVARASSELLEALVTSAPARNREAEAAKARARAAQRYAAA